MLVNCPKCGFSQPKDRYCASCGVDMEIYRPRSIPFWKKFLRSPYLHVVLVMSLVFASVFYVRQKQKEELQARVEYLKGGPLLVERSQRNTPPVQVDASSQAQAQLAQSPPPSAAPAAALAPPAENTASAEPGAGPTAEVADTAISGQKATPAAAAAAAAQKNAPTRAMITYAEIEVAVLNAWMEEMRTSNQLRSFDEVTMGPLAQATQKLRSGRGIKVLQRIEQPLSQPPSPVDWFLGTHRGADPENEMGFYSSLHLGDSKDGLVRGELEVQRAFRDPKDPAKTMERVSYGGPFELPAGSGFLMRGLLPRKFITDLEDEANSDAVLSIFKSRAFKEGQTEFTLILEFDNNSPQAR